MRVALLLLLLACSKKDDPNKLPPTGQGDIVPSAPVADPAPPPPAASDNAACKLLTQAEAKQLVGVELPQQEAHTDPVGTLFCSYKNKTPYTKVELAVSPRGQTMYDEQDKLGMFKGGQAAGAVVNGKYVQIMVITSSPMQNASAVQDALKTMTGRL